MIPQMISGRAKFLHHQRSGWRRRWQRQWQQPFNGLLSGTTRVSQYQKGKTSLDLLQQETNGSGISWAICKSAPCPRQITTPASHHSVFYRLDALPPFLPPNQQCQITEGTSHMIKNEHANKTVVHMRTKRWCSHGFIILSNLLRDLGLGDSDSLDIEARCKDIEIIL